MAADLHEEERDEEDDRPRDGRLGDRQQIPHAGMRPDPPVQPEADEAAHPDDQQEREDRNHHPEIARRDLPLEPDQIRPHVRHRGQTRVHGDNPEAAFML